MYQKKQSNTQPSMPLADKMAEHISDVLSWSDKHRSERMSRERQKSKTNSIRSSTHASGKWGHDLTA